MKIKRIDLTYKGGSFCFTVNETKESITKRVEEFKKHLDKMNKDKVGGGGFHFNESASTVYKDYEETKKKLLAEK